MILFRKTGKIIFKRFIKIDKEKLFNIDRYLNSVKSLDENIDNFEIQTKQKGIFH